MLVNATKVDYPAKLNSVELMDLRGRSIAKFPLIQNPDLPSLYNVTSFIPPDQFFYVKVSAIIYIYIERERERQRQTDRQTDRQTGRQTETDRHI